MATITVDDSGGTDVVYTEILAASGLREFRALTDTATALKGIVFQNTFRKDPKTGVDRRRIHIFKYVEDSESGVVHKASVTTEIVLPPTEDLTLTHLKDMISFLIGYVGRNSSGVVDYGNVQSIMSGAVIEGDLAV